MKYIVMECLPSCAVLLDEKGRFVKAANLHYQVGQTVTDPVLLRRGRCLRSRRWGLVAGVLAACVTLALALLVYQNFFAVYATVTLEINPQVRIELNRQGRVLDVKPVNGDGFNLLADYDGPDDDLDDTAEELLDLALAQGYLTDGGRVSVYIDAPRDSLFRSYGILLRTKLTEHLSGRVDAALAIYAGSLPEQS